MPKPKNINLDAAAYFAHLRAIGSDALERHKRWCFSFRCDEVGPIEEFAEFLHPRLSEFFHLIIQDSVEEIQPDGKVNEGPPLLRVEYVGVLDERTLAGLHKRFAAMAKERGLTYEGASAASDFPLDLDIFDAAIAME